MYTLSPYLQTGVKQSNFKGLKEIKYLTDFNPKMFSEQEKLVKTIKENKVIQDFFQNRDGIITLDNFFLDKKDYTVMSLKSRPRNFVFKLLSKIVGDDILYKQDMQLYSKDYYTSAGAKQLAEKVKNLKAIEPLKY